MKEEIKYDMVVLGGGPGGYSAAFRAADLGLNVCLIESQNRLGGVCLNVGCIPSKTLLHGAAVLEKSRNIGELGIIFENTSVDLKRMRARKTAVIKQLTDGLDSLAKARKIIRVKGTARFIDKETIRVEDDAGHSIMRFKNAVIATGSSPVPLSGIP